MGGQGIYVTPADGRRSSDRLAGAGAPALGHNHPVVSEALRAALDRCVAWQTLDIATPLEDEVAEPAAAPA